LPNIYLIAGCNGAGKTTASYTMLPKMLDCKEFVNADNIASGLSPFQPESVSIEAGKMLLERIDKLIEMNVDFAIETTLSGRNYLVKIRRWQKRSYKIILVFFWLRSSLLALERIKNRVSMGGHSVPEKIVFERYHKGLKNLFNNFIPICDSWFIIDNSDSKPLMIAEGRKEVDLVIYNKQIWFSLKDKYYGK